MNATPTRVEEKISHLLHLRQGQTLFARPVAAAPRANKY